MTLTGRISDVVDQGVDPK